METFNVKLQFNIGRNQGTWARDRGLTPMTDQDFKDAMIANLGRFWDCFNIAETVGYWLGKPEVSYTVTVYTDETGLYDHVARELCEALQQDAILLDTNGVGRLIYIDS